ncbi:MAG: FkbM family methyltransferase [Clostridiales bacterium]|jgi:FkbM family methyltransferase|nr:FkbM family methyltransferase [Clostridiales bacterium]
MERKQLLEHLESMLCSKTDQYYRIDNFRKYPIAIYGAGSIGRKIYVEMKNLGFNIICFFDRSAVQGTSLFNLPVYTVENDVISESEKGRLVVALAINTHILDETQIENYLYGLGYNQVISAYSLIMPHISQFENLPEYDRDAENRKKLFAAAVCFEDEHSNEIYYRNLEAHYSADYKTTIKSEGTIQYFDVKVPFTKGYSKFVDIGAYDGDSLEKLMELHECDQYIAFEPEKSNYELLAKKATEYQDRIKEMLLIPCAVGNKNSFMAFSIPTAMGGNISENGTTNVQVVRIDDMLKCDVTMIKMDIEGLEISAIEGSKSFIKHYKPDLAICVYHFISDIWEILLILQSLVPEYKFYLRSHEDFTMETVLYATIR